MTTLCQRDSTIVNRVRLHSSFGDGLAAQQKIGHLLRSTVVRPSALPPSAILIVRTLNCREPETGWLNYKSLYLPREWQKSTTEELDRLTAQAARPGLAPVPPLAEAVLFADRAELLACLAQDWVRGTLRTNWWWSTFLKQGDPDISLFREWTQSPEYLPAAFEILAARNRATEFLERLPHHVVSLLLDNMLVAFAVPRVVQADADPEPSPFQDGEPPHKPVAEPWFPLVPEASTPDLAPRKRLLLACALMLRRAPVCARSISFQQETSRWQACAEHTRETCPDEICAPTSDPPATNSSPDIVASVAGQLIDEASEASYRAPAIETETDFSASRTPPILEMADLSWPEADTLEVTAPGKLNDASALLAQVYVESGFGGVFFLLNVVLHLKLYADFTSPRAANLELDIWDFLYLLGSRFVPPEMNDDKVFPLLATLACRAMGEGPGERFQPPENWRLPPEWLDAFPESFEWQETIRDGRLQVTHPAGFLLVDEQHDAAPQAVKRLDRWLTWIAAYVEARLIRALGRNGSVHFLCAVPARVTFTASHLDVFYPLDVHPVEIRNAGLDRNPGWIPATGKFVAFHFE